MHAATELASLHRELLLDHSKRPRNFRQPADATGSALGHNRLCGDKLRLFVSVEGGAVRDVAFQGTGCAISTASASLMSEAVKGLSVEEAHDLFERFHAMVTAAGNDVATDDTLGKLVAFAGVRKYPARVKCATPSAPSKWFRPTTWASCPTRTSPSPSVV